MADATAEQQSAVVTYEALAELENEFDDVEMDILRQQTLLQAPLLQRRADLISRLPNFWPLVIEQAPPEVDQFIQPSDSHVLTTYLRSIDVTRFEVAPYAETEAITGSPRSVAIKFTFAPNEWFEDEVLEKKFWWRRSQREGSAGLVSEPVRIRWKGESKDLTEGLTDVAYNAWEAENKASASDKGTNGKTKSEVNAMLPERRALERRIEQAVEGSLSFFTWFAYRGRDISAESAKAMEAERQRREALRNGEILSDSKARKQKETESKNLDEDDDESLDDMPPWEAFPGGEELAVAISDDLFPNAIKYFVQAQEEDRISDADFEDEDDSSSVDDRIDSNLSTGTSKKRQKRRQNDGDEESDDDDLMDMRGLVGMDEKQKSRKRVRPGSDP